jgi:hypothetical protein
MKFGHTLVLDTAENTAHMSREKGSRYGITMIALVIIFNLLGLEFSLKICH